MTTLTVVSGVDLIPYESERAFFRLYDAMRTDDLARYYWTDSMPSSASGFRQAIQRETFGMLLHEGNTPLALCLLTTSGGYRGQVQLYIMKVYRCVSKIIWDVFTVSTPYEKRDHLCAYIHPEHRQAQMFARQVMKLHRVQRLPAYARIQGKLVDMIKYAEVTNGNHD